MHARVAPLAGARRRWRCCSPARPACGGGPTRPATGSQVAAAFYPLAFVAERVAGDLVEVTNLTTPGGEPHDLELSHQRDGRRGAGRPRRLRARLPAGRRRRRRQRGGGRGARRRRRWSTCRTRHPPDAATTRTSGRTPRAWPTSPTPSPRSSAGPTRTTGTTTLANAEELRARADRRSTRTYRTRGWPAATRDTIVVSHDAFGYLRSATA